MSSASESNQRPESPSAQKEKPKTYKLFVTNLDSETPFQKLEQNLRQQFEKFGQLDSVVVKKSYKGDYCYAFIDYKEGQDATEAINTLNQQHMGGQKMRVQPQDDLRRRKGASEGCYNCGKRGHFARECHANGSDSRRREYRRRSRSEQYHRHKRSKRRDRSSSSDESRSARKKQRRRHDKSRKKHSKKSRKNESDSSD